MRKVLAIDIGASSGRHIVGWSENGEIQTHEVFRFGNGVEFENGFLVWNIEALEKSIKQGIDEALKLYPDIVSLSVDTWGVDYVLLNKNQPIFPCISYRNGNTNKTIDSVHDIVSLKELYKATGIQFQPFNSIYQLFRDLKSGKLENATDFLMIPEYFLYKLCGNKVKEYTNATTTGLVNINTKQFDRQIIHKLGLPDVLFKDLQSPGQVIGNYKNMDCVLCATHDTASAVNGIPIDDSKCYISSGTWSLIGVKSAIPITAENSLKTNWSNEGGIGYYRYQKNIMGMWLVNKLRSELCPNESFENITNKAERSSFSQFVDADDSRFLSPLSMKEAFDSVLTEAPNTIYGYFRCAYLSLAKSYKRAIDELEGNTGKTYKEIYIVGGGANNKFLNKLTELETGKKVVALPIEASAIGNIRLQLDAIEGKL